jgi:hypothetical protein
MTFGGAVLEFLEQELDPFQTKSANVDIRTASFISLPCEESKGNDILLKLQLSGYFDQGRDLHSVKSDRNYEFVNLLLSSVASATAIAVLVTPLDMAIFKQHSLTTGMGKNTSFYKILQGTF